MKTNAASILAISFFIFSCFVASDPAHAAEDGFRVTLVQSGYPGSPRAARGFLETFSAYLEKKTSVEDIVATYDNVPKDALETVAKTRPTVGVVSFGFYLEHRKTLGLRAHLEAVPAERFYIVAPKGKVKSADSLAKSPVAGGALYEPSYLDAIVFPKLSTRNWQATPTLRPTRALRKLAQGRYAALVVNGREYRSFEALGKLKELDTLAESSPLPVAMVVSFGLKTDNPSAEVTAFLQALVGLKNDKDGQELLRTMNCKEFRPPDARQLSAFEKQFDDRTKPAEKK